MSWERWVLFSQEHCREDQWVKREGIPSPPAEVGEKIIYFLDLLLLPLRNLQIICSTSSLYSFLGRGNTVTIWVILDELQVFVILTFAVVNSVHC